jgi:hypothetical protein
MAGDCIRRGLDALEAEPAATPDPEPTLAEVQANALAARVAAIEAILLEINVDACMKHGLNPF